MASERNHEGASSLGGGLTRGGRCPLERSERPIHEKKNRGKFRGGLIPCGEGNALSMGCEKEGAVKGSSSETKQGRSEGEDGWKKGRPKGKSVKNGAV